MDWCMNHQDTSVRFARNESTNTQGQIIYRGIVPQPIDIMTRHEADLSPW